MTLYTDGYRLTLWVQRSFLSSGFYIQILLPASSRKISFSTITTTAVMSKDLFHYSPCIKQLEDLSVDDIINKVCLGSLFQGESCSSSPKKVKKKYSKIKLLRKQPANMFRCIIFCYLTQYLTEIGSTFVCVSSTEVILTLLGEK